MTKTKTATSSTALCTVLRDATPPSTRTALEALAQARYPIRDAAGLAQLVPNDDDSTSADLARQMLAHFTRPDELPLDTAATAVSTFLRRLHGRRFPFPGGRPVLRRVPTDFDPDLDFVFPDNACGRAAEAWLATQGGRLRARNLATIVLAIDACKRHMPSYPPGACGDQARAAFAQMFLETLLSGSGGEAGEIPLLTTSDRREQAREAAAAWASLAFINCLLEGGERSLVGFLGPVVTPVVPDP